MIENDIKKGDYQGTMYLATKEEFTIEDLKKIWPGKELSPQIAKILLTTIKRIGPGQIFLPKFEGNEALIWIVKGKLLLGGMRGNPLEFFPVIECGIDGFVPINEEIHLEFRGGDRGAILLVLPKDLVSRMIQNPLFLKKLLLSFERILFGIVEKVIKSEKDEEVLKIRNLALEIFKLSGGRVKK